MVHQPVSAEHQHGSSFKFKNHSTLEAVVSVPKPKTVKETPIAVIAPETVSHATKGCEMYRSLVAQYDWDIDTALAIMKAESGCDPAADNTGTNANGSNDKGLLQINSVHSDLISDLDRLDPTKNIRAAYEIYRGSGWRAWSSFNSGKYKQFL
ncbi:transglycosylase SLT domain-containing protein [Subtercola sp. RTI3]|uniref:transglycosylase SLT domain-containing protein n=1 Tax=Subtercola sp. RTI3 TaxID=3048639 RepID=UPI002B23ECF8|nr:transglycosylase SLT domain-containing protein [Subtercola sp. RTI3]MEA9985660.1 transglycosylase SLT domain-containing protein [Subtercola sp. RTI3]